MKVRNFYPWQVAKRLNRKSPSALSEGEKAALRFFTMKGRKVGVSVQIAQTDLAGFQGVSMEEAAAILENSNQTIFMRLT